MNPITQAYLECALWSSSDDNEESFDDTYDVDDIHPDSVRKAEKACLDFWETNKELLQEALLTEEEIGYDFWLTRNGHGAGFWDRCLGEIGEKLTAACKAYGESCVYIGDDGSLYVG